MRDQQTKDFKMNLLLTIFALILTVTFSIQSSSNLKAEVTTLTQSIE